jgi:uncharacterized protein (AIM24 family)
MRSDIFAASNMETQSPERFALHHKKTLKVTLGAPVLAKKGSMIAFQGGVEFHHKSAGGIGKFLKQQLSGEDVDFMTVSGQGEVFLADFATDIFLIELEGDGVSVNGANLLAMDADLAYDVHRVQGAGMLSGGAFNTLVRGTGKIAITCDGPPLILDCSQQPTAVDINAAVCWSANLSPTLRNSMNLKSMLRGGTGEAFQYVFHGPGFVIVQPSEGQHGVPPHEHPANQGGSGLSGLLNAIG